MFGDNFAKELKSIPLSNDTVSRRIDIAEDVQQLLFGKLYDKLFSIQLDEPIDSNKDVNLIAYVRFWDGSFKSIQALVKQKSPLCIWTHCMIHREALASKERSPGLNIVLTTVVNVVNYMKMRPIIKNLFWTLQRHGLSEANTQVYVETPLHPGKLTVWCALWAGRIIGPYFFKNDEGHNVTVNGDRYRAMITNFLIPEWNNHDVQKLWFRQDGATCHTARATIDLLKDTFGDHLISRFGHVNWPSRSCDLTPLDYSLWGYVKSLVCADKPQTLDHLEDNIHRVIANIRPQMLEKVIENWTSRLDNIRISRGSPMPEIIFKIKSHKIIFRIKKIYVNRIIHRCFIAI
ncbi:putative transposable element [Trichonephila clavipes]|nr:putative transposable element [Trichonephila clavipes]